MRLEVAACLGMAKLSLSGADTFPAVLCVATVDVVCPSVSLHATVADGPPDAQQPPGGPDVVPAVFNAATVDLIHHPENYLRRWTLIENGSLVPVIERLSAGPCDRH